MADNVDIIVLDDPTIELEELSVVDYESKTENQQTILMNASVRTNTASLSPIVKIKDYIINASALESFEITCNSFVPECRLTFADVSEQFTENNYPKDGDLMKVYIGSGGKEETWKPIRIDFHILNIAPYENNGVQKFDISAEMEIPNFELDRCEVFKDKTSFDTCREVAKNLKLGFSSNIQNTDDAQVWINNYTTDKAFLSNVVNHAYLDENSFITAFIDLYYYFNFVECNAIVNDADNDERGVNELDTIKYITDTMNADPDFKYTEENEGPDFITNSNHYIASNIGITYFGPVNNCGNIVQLLGKKVYTRYWDDNEEEYRVEFITPFISEGQNLKQVTQLEENNKESVKEFTKKLVMPAQTDNVHKNYNYAIICNTLNVQEIDKYGLSVTLRGFNPQITRFQKKYVAIYTQSFMVQSDNMDKETKKEGQATTQVGEDGILNKELSGFYTVTKLSHELVNGYLMTNLELRKRAIKNKQQ